MTERMTRRALNRATLARQHLLRRAAMPALAMVEHLGGMQSQAPLAPYVGLWTRVAGFGADELSGLTQRREVVRLHLMRTTVHLVSARDAPAWRPLFGGRGGPPVERLDELLVQARDLLAGEPLSRAELRRRLAALRPGADPDALAVAVSRHIPLCQVPPRGVWGRPQPVAWTPVETWLGRAMRAAGVDDLVRRYLGAFGPASVADAQAWSGLTRLAEVFDRLPLRAFATGSGPAVYDLPGAPRPDPETPAPPRLLPEYDNLLLSYRDRTRVNPLGRPVPLPPGNGANGGTFLLDGMWAGTWRLHDRVLRLTAFRPPATTDRDALQAEAARLGAFITGEPLRDITLDTSP